jgi:hypothetical protein
MADLRKLGKGMTGALAQAKDMAKAKKAPQADAMRLAQRRAALPPEKGGLGLAKNNTPEQRANAMGIKTDAYHGTKQDITGAFKPGYDDNLAFVTKSPEFANKWIGKGKLQQRSGEQAQQEVKSAEDAYREMKSRNMNYDALNDLKGDEFNAEYDRRNALVRAEAKAEFGSPGYPDGIHSTVYPLKVEANNTFNPETDMDVMAEFFEKNEIPPKLQELYASGNYMMYETKPVVAYLKSKGYDSMRLRESTGDDYPTIAVFNPETTRSRFAAFDPFRKDAATAAAMGVLAPDLLAEEADEPRKADGGPIRVQPKKPKDSAQGFMDKLQQAAQEAQKIPTSPLGFLLNTGYAGYKHFTGKDPLADLQRELDRKLNPKLDTGSEPVQQFEKLAAGGGVKHMADAGKVTRGITGALTKAKEMAQAKKASESKIADVLESQQAPMTRPQGTGLPLMPRDNGMYTLREQKDLPRMPMVDKARAEGKSPKYNERMQDLLDSPKARKKVDKLINKGKDLNVQEWYGTEPLRQVALNAGRTPEQFESMLAQFASASQRNPVDKQNQMGSYLYHLSETGQLPENSLLLTNKLKKALKEDPSLAQGRQLVELPTGYGSLAQGDIFNRAVMIGQGDIAGALPPNKKLGTFYENLLGNVKPVTVDVNALRGPIIEQGDPRWLTSKLVEKDETGKIINSYKPREMYNSGEMSMREAQQRPGFWEAAPSGSEYAGFEELWQRGAKRHNIEPAEAQALGWYGSADVTALKTKPENYVDNLERLIKRTAEQTGKSPTEVMNDMVTGKGFLRKDGGAVKSEESPEDMARFHKRFAMHKALGGRVSSRPVKKMAEGGRASIFDAPAKRMSKGGSSDEPTTREIAEALGELAMTQGKEEYQSFKKPRAATDIGNRGILAPALGLPVDMINMGLGGVDALTGLMGKPTRLSSEKPFAGSEHIKDLMNKYGVTSGEDRPMTETALSLFSPTGMIKGAQGMTKGAVKAAGAMRKPMSGLNAMREKTN